MDDVSEALKNGSINKLKDFCDEKEFYIFQK